MIAETIKSGCMLLRSFQFNGCWEKQPFLQVKKVYNLPCWYDD
ncbi:hypothetical protein NBRC111894_2181 [Sporolactobacillus inulinus]|uniref:Uncharacterized protein n=1 Tax=Sporolactobacillus inulinus TaxID=2078 RepID=A0A4Y1ZC30_9BACL|nr:hypothetical protein NBRC111894_2181 [Sporolactobacillus inulinus]